MRYKLGRGARNFSTGRRNWTWHGRRRAALTLTRCQTCACNASPGADIGVFLIAVRQIPCNASPGAEIGVLLGRHPTAEEIGP
eukprot:5062672-Pyramimonas_sp.AAC.1